MADRDRMLVVSTVHTPFVRRSHLAHMLEACLGGPLPGIHVVIKQHPGERDEGPYRDLLHGLARAGGYAPHRSASFARSTSTGCYVPPMRTSAFTRRS